MDVAVIETSTLGDRSYLVHDGSAGVVVDPQRDIDRVLAVAGRLGVRITHVAETHLHNDYVSGGLALSRLTGATYLVAGAEKVGFIRTSVADGDVIAISPALTLTVIATPGHTFNHLSYAFADADGPYGVCTGGSLLFGTTGRTDLLGSEHTHELAHHQHASAPRLADLLPDGTRVWPTHGFGSFCSATPPDADDSTIGRERRANPVLRLHADDYVTQLIAGLNAYPAYYAHMGARNADGAEPIDLTPPAAASPDELRRRLDAGEWVVDLRTRRAFAARHLIGAISFGLDGNLATWLGWLLPHGAPLTLLADTPDEITAAQRELARIGIDRPAAASTTWHDQPASRFRSLQTATFKDLAAYASPDPYLVLDVRASHEYRESHIEGALNIPLPALADEIPSLPAGLIWVHCAAGYRAATAASLLARAGRETIHIDDAWQNAEAAALPLVTG